MAKLSRLAALLALCFVFSLLMTNIAYADCKTEFNSAKESYDNGDYEAAARGFKQVVENYRNCALASESLYMTGQSLEELGNEDGAISAYSTLIRSRPDSTFAKRAEERIKELNSDLTQKDIEGIAKQTASDISRDTRKKDVATTISGIDDEGIEWEAVSVVLVLIGAAIGWISTRREKNKVAGLMTKIDSEYTSYKMKPRQCENELVRLRDKISVEFKASKIDSSSYAILDKRIDDYLIELRERIAEDRFEEMPDNLKDGLSRALEDGTINEKDVKALTEFVKGSDMSDKKKKQFEEMIKEWKKEDSGEIKHEKKSFMWGYISKVPWTRNRIAIFSFIVAGLLLLGGLGALSSGNPGGILILMFGILTLIGGIYLRKKKQSGIKLLKIAYWILLVFWILVFVGQPNPLSIITLLISITVLYHLKYMHIAASAPVSKEAE